MPATEIARVVLKSALARATAGVEGARFVGAQLAGVAGLNVQTVLEALKTLIDQKLGSEHISDPDPHAQYLNDARMALRSEKLPCRALTLTNIDLAVGGLLTVDGVTLSAGDRVLVRAQTTASQNGIYIAAAGAWTRATDADTAAKLEAGASVVVLQGTNQDQHWMLSTNAPITLGTTGLFWVRLSASNHPFSGGASHAAATTTLAGFESPEDKIATDSWKRPVRVASTANIDLTVGGLLTVDGVALAAGDRVLVKNQTTPSQNGIYVAAAGAWTRATDADVATELLAGFALVVGEGSTQADSIWLHTTDGAITLGTTALTFARSSQGAQADASQAVKGVSKLSVAPVTASDPIAVGDNDPRNTNARSPVAHGHLLGDLPVAASGVSDATRLTRSDDQRLGESTITYVFDTPGSFVWTKPAGCTSIEVIAQGGGGGGASGRRGASLSVRCGGGGGGGGCRVMHTIPAFALGLSETVLVGAGGGGGAAVAINDTNGNNGVAGGDSRLGAQDSPALALAPGGGGGNGGTAASGSGGLGRASMFNGANGGGASPTGGGGNLGNGSVAGPGGGAGGGITSADVQGAGGNGGISFSTVPTAVAGGAAGGGAGAGGTSCQTGSGLPGGGGSGGGAASTVAAGGGGSGGNYGAGGGGGGASLNGFTSGAGGAGAAGFVIIVAKIKVGP